MPTIFSAGAASAQGFGNQLPAFAPFNMMTANQVGFTTNAIQDSLGNIIYYTKDITDPGGALLVTKTDNYGSKLWQTDIGGYAGYYLNNIYGMTTDSSNNIYIAANSNLAATGFQLFKLNSSGTLLLSSYYSCSTATVNYLTVVNTLRVDSSLNVYIAGYANTTTSNVYYSFVIKISSTFAVTWATAFTYTTTATLFNFGYDVAVDSSGNVFVLSQAYGSYYIPYVVKLTSAGAVSNAAAFFNGTAGLQSSYSLTIDASNNVYIALLNPFQMIKTTNTLSAITWQTGLTDFASSYFYYPQITSYTDGNIYAIGYGSNPSSITSLLMSSFNATTGAVNNQIYISPPNNTYAMGTTYQYNPPSITSNIMVFGYTDSYGTVQNGVVRLPISTITATSSSKNLTLGGINYNLVTNPGGYTSSTPTNTLAVAAVTTQTFAIVATSYSEVQYTPSVPLEAASFS